MSNNSNIEKIKLPDYGMQNPNNPTSGLIDGTNISDEYDFSDAGNSGTQQVVYGPAPTPSIEPKPQQVVYGPAPTSGKGSN